MNHRDYMSIRYPQPVQIDESWWTRFTGRLGELWSFVNDNLYEIRDEYNRLISNPQYFKEKDQEVAELIRQKQVSGEIEEGFIGDGVRRVFREIAAKITNTAVTNKVMYVAGLAIVVASSAVFPMTVATWGAGEVGVLMGSLLGALAVLRESGAFRESAIGQVGMHNDASMQRGGQISLVTTLRPLRVMGTLDPLEVYGTIEGGTDVMVVDVRAPGRSLTKKGQLYGAEEVVLLVRNGDFRSHGNVPDIAVDFEPIDSGLDSSWYGPWRVMATISDFSAATGLNEEVDRQVLRRYPNLERQDAKALREHLMRETLSAVMRAGVSICEDWDRLREV